jgi:hypothetical protein
MWQSMRGGFRAGANFRVAFSGLLLPLSTQSHDFVNMKSFVALLFIALFASAQATSSALVARSVGGLARPQDISPPQGDWCEACVIFMNTQIQELIQIIVNIGVEDGCAYL